jgi:hypothetical protein
MPSMRVVPKIEARVISPKDLGELVHTYQFTLKEISSIRATYDATVSFGDASLHVFDAALLKMDEHYSSKGWAPFECSENQEETGFNRALRNGIVALTAAAAARGYGEAVNKLGHSGEYMSGVMHVAMAEAVHALTKGAIRTEFAPLGLLVNAIIRNSYADAISRTRAFVAKRFLTVNYMDAVPDPKI